MREAVREFKACSPPAIVLKALGQGVEKAAVQSMFVQQLEQDRALVQCPPRAKYFLSVLQALATLSEVSTEGYSSDIVYAKIAELTSSRADDECSHVSFEISDTQLSVRVFDRCNQLGLRLWPAAELMAAWAIAQPTQWSNATVIELGAGVGLSGLAVASFCAPRTVYLTDGDDMVTQNLRYNVELNGLANCRAMRLDWATFSSDSPILNEPDLMVIATDCVYDSCTATELAKVLHLFADVGARIWLANAIRNERTWATSLMALHENGLSPAEELNQHIVAAVDAAPHELLPKSVWRKHRQSVQQGELKVMEITLSKSGGDI